MQRRTCCSAIVITKLFHAHKEIQETVSNHNTVLFARIRLRDFYLTRPFVTQSFVLTFGKCIFYVLRLSHFFARSTLVSEV